ncbi:TPA: helix-turn-helix transcriptional regulator [Yersinia enterocolitica]|nr:helix-turn-helix transcriptional regulator [Yersinia enterocolitica]
MPAKPLTPEQKADAERLMAIFKKQKGLTQAVLADELGFSNQSAVSQYLNGKIPLNVEASIKFADKLGCQISDFSPFMQSEIDRIANYATSYKERAREYSGAASSGWDKYSKANAEKKAVVDFFLLDNEDRQPEWIDSDARAYADSLEAKARRWLEGGIDRSLKKSRA